jgi:hypothetical protein
MKAQEAAKRLKIIMCGYNISEANKEALRVALEALRGNPCAVCINNPPTAGDGRPCAYCPAASMVWEEDLDEDESKTR